MTKRSGTFTDVKTKKIKVTDNFDELWGEDPNIDDIDDCLLLASQACQRDILNCTQLNNVSILPNYNLFKENSKNVFTSTQNVPNNFGPSSSANFVKPHIKYENKATIFNGNSGTNQNNVTIKDLEQKLQELKEKYELKEGEVSILRSQLKETRTTLGAEYQKKEKELSDKVNVSTKEINSIRSQLEFKNLELVNLNNKLQEMCKVYAVDNGLNNSVAVEKQININRYTTSTNYKTEPYIDTKRPLIEAISPNIFKCGQPENVRNFKSNQNDTEENKITDFLGNNKKDHHTFDSLYPHISVIISSDLPYINSEFCQHHIDHVVSTSHIVLSDFYKYLTNFESHCHKENTEQNNEDYSNKTIFDSRALHNREIGIKARQTIAVLAEILPCCVYLQKMFLNFIEKNTNCKNYLNLIHMIVTLIRVKKMGNLCQGFLCAVSNLLFRISQTKIFEKWYTFVSNVVKEIVFTEPSASVTKNIVLFFKQASINTDFVEELCKTSRSSVRTTNKEEISSIEDSCLLQAFIMIYKKNFLHKDNNVDVSLNALQFVTNLLNSHPLWLHYQENKHCECLCEIGRLAVNVIHDCVKTYKDQCKRVTCSHQYHDFLMYSIKVLHIVNSKYFDIIHKYPVDSEYKFIINFLFSIKDDINMSEYDYETLQELTIQDDIANIKISFDKIPIWR